MINSFPRCLVLALVILGCFGLQAQFSQSVITPDKLFVKDGFKVELLYNVPKNEQGSWVAMCIDPRGRVLTSDQYGKLYRVTPPAPGKQDGAKVEPINLEIGRAQGMAHLNGALYVVTNDNAFQGRGLYRISDTNADDQYDKVDLLFKFQEYGREHGPHDVVPSPDGKHLYLVVGNQTELPKYDKTRVPPFWGEDLLLPRVYGRGYMKGVEAPRGWVARVDLNGKNCEIIATGFRNQYAAAFDKYGELFTYDADMEWDVATPWYRPTRICQIASGGEFGWRNGSGKWPEYFPDSLPPVVNVGPGSPTGVNFGYGAAFPRKYQEALFACDWSYGKLYAIHLSPKGASYEAEVEEFLSGQPLPLTDLAVSPKDHALYFTVGGRKTQSGLYRVTYVGTEDHTPIAYQSAPAPNQRFRQRQRIERFHGVQDPQALTEAWPLLASEDRFLRAAARVAVEHQPVASWRAKALQEGNPRAALAALVALARTGDQKDRGPAMQALAKLPVKTLAIDEKLELIRAYTLVFMRLGKPTPAEATALGKSFLDWLPHHDARINAELVELLVYLETPGIAAKGIAMLEAAPSQEEQIEYAKSLRLLKSGWTPDLQRRFFEWFGRAAGYRGGASFTKFVDEIRDDALAGLSPAQKKQAQAVLAKAPKAKNPMEAMAAALAGRSFVKNWQAADLLPDLTSKTTGRNFAQGRKMFGAAACYSCHRMGMEGGAVGPDLTTAGGKFSHADLLESILEPSKEVSDQYAPIEIKLKNGQTILGRVGNMREDEIMVSTDMFNPQDWTKIKRQDVLSAEPSKVSLMPPGLLNMLTKEEILDLFAYVLSGGDPDHRYFKK